MTGDCTIIPAAAIKYCNYLLVTGIYDLSSPAGNTKDSAVQVQILAVAGTGAIGGERDRITYQLFYSGMWGPVRHSGKLEKGLSLYMEDGTSRVVCRNAVYWLAGPSDARGFRVTCTVALDARTGRAWTTQLPKQCHFFYHSSGRAVVLATSGDGQLCAIRSLPDHLIHVWVLAGDGEWTLRQTVDLQSMLPHCPKEDNLPCTILTAFCPRSGCLIGIMNGNEIRIDIESGLHPSVERIGDVQGYRCFPYEMDWSTYISKMKLY